MARRVTLYQEPSCRRCREMRHRLEALPGVDLIERDIRFHPPDAAFLEARLAEAGGDGRSCLDTRSGAWRRLGLSKGLPPREELARLMASEPGLIRRPLVVRGQRAVFGFDEAAIRDLLE